MTIGHIYIELKSIRLAYLCISYGNFVVQAIATIYQAIALRMHTLYIVSLRKS
ncbi:MAG: hypothetical protein F6K40_15600 [Okeania sp. SIO3I5]|uniref:hypothetical protein n=1 Tax=Okeania sp. SIO3I5 TaxID=2607805 RepID=UPI0013B6ECB7|nr:hypothetical protein [Okeania sp. SIO3I5]NEQ37610.1 hypothetical protein [Okeania sp. SIO3I5]